YRQHIPEIDGLTSIGKQKRVIDEKCQHDTQKQGLPTERGLVLFQEFLYRYHTERKLQGALGFCPEIGGYLARLCRHWKNKIAVIQRSGIERLKIPGMNRITELPIHIPENLQVIEQRV